MSFCTFVFFFLPSRWLKVSEEESGKSNYAHALNKNPARNLMDANQKLRIKD